MCNLRTTERNRVKKPQVDNRIPAIAVVLVFALALWPSVRLIKRYSAVRLMQQAQMYRHRGDLNRAVDLCRQAVEHRSNSGELRLLYGNTLADAGRDRDALLQLKKAAETYPTYGLFLARGMIYSRLNEHEKRVGRIQSGAVLFAEAPDHSDAQRRIAVKDGSSGDSTCGPKSGISKLPGGGSDFLGWRVCVPGPTEHG